MAKKAKAGRDAAKVISDGVALLNAVLDPVVESVSERPEVYDERADAKEAKQKAAFAAAALRAVSDASTREPAKVSENDAIKDSRRSLLSKLAPGQKFFESPEGFIVVGNSEDDTIWCQQANGGHGMKINPLR